MQVSCQIYAMAAVSLGKILPINVRLGRSQGWPG